MLFHYLVMTLLVEVVVVTINNNRLIETKFHFRGLQQLYVLKMIHHQLNFVYDIFVQDDISLDFQDVLVQSIQKKKKTYDCS